MENPERPGSPLSAMSERAPPPPGDDSDAELARCAREYLMLDRRCARLGEREDRLAGRRLARCTAQITTARARQEAIAAHVLSLRPSGPRGLAALARIALCCPWWRAAGGGAEMAVARVLLVRLTAMDTARGSAEK